VVDKEERANPIKAKEIQLTATTTFPPLFTKDNSQLLENQEAMLSLLLLLWLADLLTKVINKNESK
jgi:hypothetical protein